MVIFLARPACNLMLFDNVLDLILGVFAPNDARLGGIIAQIGLY